MRLFKRLAAYKKKHLYGPTPLTAEEWRQFFLLRRKFYLAAALELLPPLLALCLAPLFEPGLLARFGRAYWLSVPILLLVLLFRNLFTYITYYTVFHLDRGRKLKAEERGRKE